MGFIDNIRMSQLFPASRGANNTGPGVFGTPQVRSNDNPFDQPVDPISQFAQRILPLLHGEQDRSRNFQLEDENRAKANHLESIANAAAHPNVVLGQAPGQIRPLDAAKLAQGQEKIDASRDKAGGELDLGKDKLAASKEHNTAIDTINKFKAEHPGMKLISPKGGNFQALDPITGQTMDLGISTGSFSDEERTNINQKNALARIDESGRVAGDNANKLEKQRQGGRVDLADINNKAKETIKTTAAPKVDKPLLPGQQTQQYNGRFMEAANTNPDWKPFLVQDPTTKTWSIMPPNTDGGPDELTYHQIGDFIYGGPAATKDTNLKSDKLPNKSKKDDPLGIR